MRAIRCICLRSPPAIWPNWGPPGICKQGRKTLHSSLQKHNDLILATTVFPLFFLWEQRVFFCFEHPLSVYFPVPRPSFSYPVLFSSFCPHIFLPILSSPFNSPAHSMSKMGMAQNSLVNWYSVVHNLKGSIPKSSGCSFAETHYSYGVVALTLHTQLQYPSK